MSIFAIICRALGFNSLGSVINEVSAFHTYATGGRDPKLKARLHQQIKFAIATAVTHDDDAIDKGIDEAADAYVANFTNAPAKPS